MKPRHKRLAIAAGIVAAVGVAAALVLNAFQSNLVFFYSPSQVAAHEAPSGAHLPPRRPGREGHAASATAPRCSFIVTDTAKSIPVQLRRHPSRPVQGRQGRRRPGPAAADGVFVAREVLAKHDENYMPPEAAEALKRAQQGNPKLAESMSAEPMPQVAMIPELGHFALWLALGVAAVLGDAADARRGARPRRLDGAGAAVGAAAVRAGRASRSSASRCASSATTSRCSTSPPTRTARCRCTTASPRSGAATKARCCCGC